MHVFSFEIWIYHSQKPFKSKNPLSKYFAQRSFICNMWEISSIPLSIFEFHYSTCPIQIHHQISTTPLSAAKRLQFSLDVETVHEMPIMSQLKPVVLPLFWIEESVDLNSTYTGIFRNLYMWDFFKIKFIESANQVNFACLEQHQQRE